MSEERSGQLLRRALVLFAAWLVAGAVWVAIVREFRASESVSLLGQTYTGNDAGLIVALCTAVSVTLLALAMHKFNQYRQLKRG